MKGSRESRVAKLLDVCDHFMEGNHESEKAAILQIVELLETELAKHEYRMHHHMDASVSAKCHACGVTIVAPTCPEEDNMKHLKDCTWAIAMGHQ